MAGISIISLGNTYEQFDFRKSSQESKSVNSSDVESQTQVNNKSSSFKGKLIKIAIKAGIMIGAGAVAGVGLYFIIQNFISNPDQGKSFPTGGQIPDGMGNCTNIFNNDNRTVMLPAGCIPNFLNQKVR
jgi:hypothetical protein